MSGVLSFRQRLNDGNFTSSLLNGGHYNFDKKSHGSDGVLLGGVERGRHSNRESADCYDMKTAYIIDDNVQQYWCQEPRRVNGTIVDGEYNEGE